MDVYLCWRYLITFYSNPFFNAFAYARRRSWRKIALSRARCNVCGHDQMLNKIAQSAPPQTVQLWGL